MSRLAATPPDARRCVPVRVADVPLEQRVEAVRTYSKDFVKDPGERLVLFDLAIDPGELIAWVAKSANGNGRRRATSVETVERLFDLREQGMTVPAIAERLGVSLGTLRGIARLGRERALEKYQELEDEEVARPIRAVLVERLSTWQPFNGNGRALNRTPCA
jgi:hypothetical protein